MLKMICVYVTFSIEYGTVAFFLLAADSTLVKKTQNSRFSESLLHCSKILVLIACDEC